MDGMKKPCNKRHDPSVVPPPCDLVGIDGVHDECWYFVGALPEAVVQGWKLYISATPGNYIRLLTEIGPLLVAHDVGFKYLKSVGSLFEMNAGLLGFSQIGKCVVVYLHDRSAIPELLRDMRSILDSLGHRGPFVPGLRQVWRGVCVFYRYGSYRSMSLRINGRDVMDDRARPNRQSDELGENPFLAFGSLDDAPRKHSILERFPVRSVICKSGKGGVFEAVDVASVFGREVIIKLGLRWGQELPDGRDGAHFVAHEYSMYELMRTEGLGSCLANVIDFSVEEDATVLVLEKIRGSNLAEWRRNGGCDTSFLKNSLSLISAIHQRGLSIGDAKLANFMACGQVIKIVDLESFQPLNGVRLANPATFNLIGLEGLSPRALDRIHFLVSAIFPGDDKVGSLHRRQSIDAFGLVGFHEPKDDWDVAVLRELAITLDSENAQGLR